jgi:hypothetical protein
MDNMTDIRAAYEAYGARVGKIATGS